jgi:hypothetical protein
MCEDFGNSGSLPSIWQKNPSPQERPQELTPVQKLFLLSCQAHKLPEPVSEYPFAPPRRWRFDWLFEALVAVEIEGGIFGKGKKCPACGRNSVGAHTSISRLQSDMEKYREAAILGYIVLRFLPKEINDGSCFPIIRRALEGKEEMG